jgi:hypothetical protein
LGHLRKAGLVVKEGPYRPHQPGINQDHWRCQRSRVSIRRPVQRVRARMARCEAVPTGFSLRLKSRVRIVD